MAITYINENLCFVKDIAPYDKSPARIHQSVDKLLRVYSTKDFLNYLDNVGMETLLFFTLWEDLDEESLQDVFLDYELDLTGQSLSEAVDKVLPNAEYLDSWTLTDIGESYNYEVTAHDGETVTLEEVRFKTPNMCIQTSSVVDTIKEVQLLAKYAAIGSGEKGSFERIPFGDYVAINSGLSWYKEIHKSISSFADNVPSEARETILKTLKDSGHYKEGYSYGNDDDQHENILDSNNNKLFFFLKETDNQAISQKIFLDFMNTFYASGELAYEIYNSFGVDIVDGRFHVFSQESPQQRFYREIANLAAEGLFAICPHCGKPFLKTSSRMAYCSDSCKTLASKIRREKALSYAYSGKSIEYAVSQIGEEYTASIKKWYKEAQSITAQMAE